jgi:hypothetical protein
MLFGAVASVVGTSGLIDTTMVRRLQLQPASYPTRIFIPIRASGLGGYFFKVAPDIYTLKQGIFKMASRAVKIFGWLLRSPAV